MAGHFFMFIYRAFIVLFTTRFKFSKFIFQLNRIGVESFYIVVLTGTFSGMVFALQTFIGSQRVGGEQFIGAIVALAMIRELGPVLTGLMVTGRAGSAVTAEIGTMAITEQIDALITLRINPFQYLVVPRILSSIIALPALGLFSALCGIAGGYIFCVYIQGLSPEDYMTSIRSYVEMEDISRSITKSCVFGLIMGWVSTYKGFYTQGGAKGVGTSTTQSVVLSSILILIVNYFLTKILERM